ncbi:MAG: DNA translocase FtsK [Acidobacteria bacterium]|nr:DNA translocase FtsK [Acidobacteriota bacterium]
MNPIIPTANRRLNELVGLLWMTLALLLLLSLASYSPTDASFNVASNASSGSSEVHNLVGTIGSYAADLMYQFFGAASFLFPLLLAGLGWRWFRSRSIGSPRAKCVGAVLLILSLTSALALFPYPLRLFLGFSAGGAVGILLGESLLNWLNGLGSAIFLAAAFIVSIYILTTFSVARTTFWLQAHFGWLGNLSRRWAAWKQARMERKQLKKALQAEKPPALAKRLAAALRPAKAPAKAEEEPARLLAGAPEAIPVSRIEKSSAKSNGKSGGAVRISRTFKLPGTGLLNLPSETQAQDEADLKRQALHLTMKCEEFDVRGTVTQINPGPVVTTFEFKPEAGVKYNRITNLVEDLCLALEAESILIERIPGKSTVGIEVPNPQREIITLREILESEPFSSSRSPLTVALGKEINGRIRVVDLAAMPHLLIAGSTGSGKSVSINNLIVSLLYRTTPEEVKLILIDPKRLELGLYEGVPHLMTPIITEPKVAANALRNAVREMERRLKVLAEEGVRNIQQYNKLFEREETLSLFETGEQKRRLPYIVIIIDELADLMMVDSNKVEISITRLAQMARAVGIHLVLATQRPSVDVITGLIKANFPARISFRVATKVDSRTILDSNGAEALLGMGDMLLLPPGSGRLVRVHSPLVTESEIGQVVDFWRAQAQPSYAEEFLKPPAFEEEGEEEWAEEKDDLYEDAVRVVVGMGKASTSTLQRRLRLGYGRAARILDIMEKDGIIGPADGSRPRELLKRPDWIEEMEQYQSDS